MRAAQSAGYLSYSEADFEVFRPAWATRFTDWGEIWRGGGNPPPRQIGVEEGILLHAKLRGGFPPPRQISPHRCNDKAIGPSKLKFLQRFDQNVEYKRPAGAYPLRDFHKIFRVCTSFQDALAVKIRWICSRGYGVMSVLS